MSGFGQETAQITYTGGTPGAGANTYTIFNSVNSFVAPRFAAMNRLKRLQVGLSNSGTGTYNWYKSESRVTSTNTPVVWTQIGTQAVVAGDTVENTNDFLIEEYGDFKLEFVNGGSAQTTWVVSIALSGERVKST